MHTQKLSTAVHTLAQQTYPFTDADLDQEWAWEPHAKGVRFALIGTYHELRDLSVVLAARRSQQGQPSHAYGIVKLIESLATDFHGWTQLKINLCSSCHQFILYALGDWEKL
ncbi:MAG: hypothetical protein KDE48_16385 [Anaerolineales bacterium]|nr:hypothetical protein [Anaerolineales bacterium]